MGVVDHVFPVLYAAIRGPKAEVCICSGLETVGEFEPLTVWERPSWFPKFWNIKRNYPKNRHVPRERAVTFHGFRRQESSCGMGRQQEQNLCDVMAASVGHSLNDQKPFKVGIGVLVMNKATDVTEDD